MDFNDFGSTDAHVCGAPKGFDDYGATKGVDDYGGGLNDVNFIKDAHYYEFSHVELCVDELILVINVFYDQK